MPAARDDRIADQNAGVDRHSVNFVIIRMSDPQVFQRQPPAGQHPLLPANVDRAISPAVIWFPFLLAPQNLALTKSRSHVISAGRESCDGTRPICGYCRTMKNSTCTFDVHSDKRKPVPRSYVATLEARIKTLEDAIQATGATLPPADPALGVFESEDAGLGLGPSNESSLSENNHPGDKSQTTPDERLPEDSGASVEAILDIGRLRLSVSRTTEDSEDLVGSSAPESSYFSYYGPTSSRFLSGQATAEPPVSGLFGRCGVRDSIDERKTSNLFDDPIETELLNKFWKWQDIHFMVVNRDIFLEAYKKGERESEWVSPMLIDMMLAIGVQFGHQGYGRKAIYAARAEALVIHELARPTMATLQAVQLLSIFQMGVGRVSVGWSLTGAFRPLHSIILLEMVGRFGCCYVQQDGLAH
ncbi:fungal specific transcription factor domain-containing protein [Rhizoctonia solani AG-1 IA]|uniref:Fungal specific transcription factor domain-containing protein n=1 Tax=Thanatephorus cucumeris (strain AG1-IA) TaxID=983506 RepID=L8X8E1_THACA|nr:fungal specific transcription factor domain-containing protein [Rhizoctonia solani AG-1 IA]